MSTIHRFPFGGIRLTFSFAAVAMAIAATTTSVVLTKETVVPDGTLNAVTDLLPSTRRARRANRRRGPRQSVGLRSVHLHQNARSEINRPSAFWRGAEQVPCGDAGAQDVASEPQELRDRGDKAVIRHARARMSLDRLFDTAVDYRTLESEHAAFMTAQGCDARIEAGGLVVEAPQGVYHPGVGSSSQFMLAHLPTFAAARCLDIGCGSGIIGLHLAREGNDVCMGDIDPRAVAAAEANSLRLGVKADIRHSDLFSAFSGQRFDVVTFNTPYWHRAPVNADEAIGCDAGGALLLRFIEGLVDVLNPQGAAWFTVANLSDPEVLQQILNVRGLRIHLAAREHTQVAGVVRGLACAERVA